MNSNEKKAHIVVQLLVLRVLLRKAFTIGSKCRTKIKKRLNMQD
jgi:hypothetical protein